MRKAKFDSNQLETIKSNKVNPVLKSHFAYSLIKAAIKLKTLINDKISHLNIIGPHIGVMLYIQAHGPISQIELGTELGIDKATMVKLIDQLEVEGIVKRTLSADDRRIKNVELTTKGQRTLDKVRALKDEVEQEFLAPLTAEEQKVLRKTLPLLIS